MDKVIISTKSNIPEEKLYTEKVIKYLQAENAELKAECEELKADIQSRTMCITCERELQNCNLQAENERLKANRSRCAFKSLDNTFCDEARIKIDKLELDRDCLNASLETARKYRGIAETDRDLYKQTLQEIKKYIAKICKEECGYVQKKRCPDSDCRYGQILAKINEVIGAE